LHVETLCNDTLQHTATHYNTLRCDISTGSQECRHVAPRYNTLHHAAPHCDTKNAFLSLEFTLSLSLSLSLSPFFSLPDDVKDVY